MGEFSIEVGGFLGGCECVGAASLFCQSDAEVVQVAGEVGGGLGCEVDGFLGEFGCSVEVVVVSCGGEEFAEAVGEVVQVAGEVGGGLGCEVDGFLGEFGCSVEVVLVSSGGIEFAEMVGEAVQRSSEAGRVGGILCRQLTVTE